MLREQSPQLPLAHPKPFGQPLNACVLSIERSFGNQSQRPRNSIGRSSP
jgi:hypothetical protein